jgi:hypothetical protein
VALPIETPQLLEMLSEPWRKDEIKAIKAQMLAQKVEPNEGVLPTTGSSRRRRPTLN